MPRVSVSILGGLPVIADVSFGYDSYSMEHWAEVDAIYWRKRDGTAGKEISQAVRDRAEKYDPYFGNLIEQANDELAGPPDDEKVQLEDFDVATENDHETEQSSHQ